jgi:hypothetical protein
MPVPTMPKAVAKAGSAVVPEVVPEAPSSGA